MVPRDPDTTHRIMSRVRSKDTRPEMLVRKELWKRGYRYRIHRRDLPGCPDLVFGPSRVVVFVDGDFWHGNAWRVRERDCLADLFPSNTEWWVDKIEGNMARDERVTRELEQLGWRVIRVWESDVLRSVEAVAGRIAEVIDARR
ncbi:MAG: very short patch repair endonuclease [Longimicrobiales bacterium]|nr:very short patch repair endonuclease [Longimicrobiales bacterium]